MATQARVTLRGRFHPGTQVELVRVAPGALAPGSDVVDKGRVDSDGVVSFPAEERQGYFIVGKVGDETVAVRMTGKVAPAPKTRTDRPGPVEARPWQREDATPLTDAKRGPQREVVPHLKQEDVPDSVPQRSNTKTGQATPVDPNEFLPRVPQSAVPKGTPQRSDTEFGDAAVVPKGEVHPAVKQSDVPKGTAQRSDTELGTAAPIPKGSALDVQQAKDSSALKAVGGVEPVQVAAKGQVEGATGKPKRTRPRAKKRPAPKVSAPKAALPVKDAASVPPEKKGAKK